MSMKTGCFDLVNKMAAVLDKKKERLKMLFFLSMQQKELFSIDSIDRLLGNLQQKQICIDDINRLDMEYAKYNSDLKDYLGDYLNNLSTDIMINAKLEHLKAEGLEIKKLIRQIQDIESENEIKAAALKQQLYKSIKATAREKKAFVSYGNSQIQSIAEDNG